MKNQLGLKRETKNFTSIMIALITTMLMIAVMTSCEKARKKSVFDNTFYLENDGPSPYPYTYVYDDENPYLKELKAMDNGDYRVTKNGDGKIDSDIVEIIGNKAIDVRLENVNGKMKKIYGNKEYSGTIFGEVVEGYEVYGVEFSKDLKTYEKFSKRGYIKE